jgi:hypothetical protein
MLQFPRELAEREPETIAWIDDFLMPSRFWDIGANVGTYVLYAALRPGVAVLAFEPAAASYAALCRNIEANRCDDHAAENAPTATRTPPARAGSFSGWRADRLQLRVGCRVRAKKRSFTA